MKSNGPEQIIAWQGEVDRIWLGHLAEQFLTAWGASHPRRVVLDLRRVTYLDGAALGLLLDVLDDCRGPDEGVTIVAGQQQPVVRLLRVARIPDHPYCRLILRGGESEGRERFVA